MKEEKQVFKNEWGWKRYAKALIGHFFPIYIYSDLDSRLNKLEQMHGIPKKDVEAFR